MKAVFVALALVASTLAQGVSIFAPAAGATVQQGSTLTVVIEKQNSLTGSQDVSVAIGLQTCGSAGCDSLPSETMGTPIFKGDYAPALNAGNDAASQSFDVQVPASLAPGAARLSVAHFYILGASEIPTVDVVHSTVNITA